MSNDADTQTRINKFLDDHDAEDPNAVRITDETQAQNLLRHHFLSKVDSIVDYWDRLPMKTTTERISGALFTVFTQFDGGNLDMPAFDIVSRDDLAFNHHGTKVMIPKGTHLCDGELHSQFVNRSKLTEEVASYQIGDNNN
jgi:hypothetical protein